MRKGYKDSLSLASVCTDDSSKTYHTRPRGSTTSTHAPISAFRSPTSSHLSFETRFPSISSWSACFPETRRNTIQPEERNEALGGLPRTTRGVQKAAVVSQHASSDFVEKHYDFVRELGEGAHGRVQLVIDRKTGQHRVCKFVSTKGMDTAMLNMMKWEVDVLCDLDHPNVVKIFEYAFDAKKSELVMVIEYLRGGDCLSLLEEADGKFVNEALIARIMYQILIALRYCHSKELVHMDVKPENIMMMEHVDTCASFVECKLIDFGGSGVPVDGIFGTIPYIAPEVMARAHGNSAWQAVDITGKADIWSLGVSTFALLMDEQPFLRPTRDATIATISKYTDYTDLQKRFSSSPAWGLRSSEAHEFLKSLLVADPATRPTADEALMHPWIQMYAWAQIDGGIRESLGTEMVNSLSSYQLAPPVARCCLYVIASRLGISDLERFGATFLRLDQDGDGIIVREDLVQALSKFEDGSSVNVDYILNAADLDHTGGIAFTEFVAACLYDRFAANGSLKPMMEQAFQALDDDRDGLITFEQVQSLFRERDALSLQLLPHSRPFSLDEWCDCLARVHSLQVSQPKHESSVNLEAPIEPPQLLDEYIGKLDFGRISTRSCRT